MKEKSIKIITIILLSLNAVIWIVFSFVYSFSAGMQGVTRGVALIVSFMLFADDIFYTAAVIGIIKKIRIIYLFSIILSLGNAFLSICDDIGPIDISMCVLNLIIFILLLLQRKTFLTKGKANEES